MNKNERKKYDMDQARAMRGERSNSTSTSINRRTNSQMKSNNNVHPSAAAIASISISNQATRRALQELDQAEELANRNKLEEASALYQQAIEYLIQYMNHHYEDDHENDHGATRSTASNSVQPSSSTRRPSESLDKEIIMERTKLALTHAEIIKSTLRKRQQQDAQQYIQLQQEQLSRRKGLSHENKQMKIPSIQTSKSAKNANANISINNNTKTAQQKRSNLNYKSNDPFIQTIKNDLYINADNLTTTWSDISGLQNAKQTLQEAAILPLLRPDLYTGLRSAPRGVLLYGPPGTGKTMLVRAIAHESDCILFACSASAMTSKWVGEGEKLVRTLFRMAGDVAPSIIFLDEMDSLLGRRKSGSGNGEGEGSRRFKTEFMVQMDGISAGSGDGNKTLLIGCTNCPWDVDDAVMRRFQRRIYIPLPDRDARKTLWKALVEKANGSVKVSSRNLDRLVMLTQGFSCSDIAAIANEAAFGPLRDVGSIEAIKGVSLEDVRPIEMKDFETSIKNAKKSVSVDLLKRYKEWESAQAAVSA